MTSGEPPFDRSDSRPEASVGTSLSLDTIFEIIADRRRRFSLYAFIDAPDETLAFESLVEDVATLEAAVDEHPITRDRYLSAAADLYHWHLPVLAEVGVVDYDERSGVVRYLARPLLETWVARVKQDELTID